MRSRRASGEILTRSRPSFAAVRRLVCSEHPSRLVKFAPAGSLQLLSAARSARSMWRPDPFLLATVRGYPCALASLQASPEAAVFPCETPRVPLASAAEIPSAIRFLRSAPRDGPASQERKSAHTPRHLPQDLPSS